MQADALTDEQLLQAWRERRRDGWPATFEAAMQSPVHSRLVRLQALHGAPPAHPRAPVQAPAPLLPAPAPSTPPGRAWRPPSSTTQAAMFDARRAASGERDD